MAGEHLFVVSIPHDDGVARDAVTNSFVFSDVDSDADREIVFDLLDDFYGLDTAGADTALSDWYSPTLNQTSNACTIKAYSLVGHLDGTPHGSPVDQRLFSLGTSLGSSAYPSEVALALTIEGLDWGDQPVEAPGGTRPRSRRRGRVFLGPFSEQAGSIQSNVMRPKSELRTVALAAASRLATDSIAAGVPWGVWSRANAAVYGVESVSVDDAFDTQRRRGERASTRTRTVIA